MNTTSLPLPAAPIIQDWEKILMTTGLTILSVFTLFGNILVVISFYTYRPLRTLTNYFIVSLSISDIMVAIINMPVWIIFVMKNMDFNIHGGKLLIAWTCFDIMFGAASILNLTAVSVDRYIHITKPLTHQKLITKKRVVSSIVFIWLFSLGLSLIKGLYWTWERPNYEMLIFCLGFLFPVIIIVFCYINIYAAVREQLQKSVGCSHLKATKPASLKKDLKAIKTIGIVVFTFFVCWCPFFALNVVFGFCGCTINPHLVSFSKWLHYFNSTLNPIIYACFNKDYRRGFRNALYKYASSANESGAFNSIIKHTSFREHSMSEYHYPARSRSGSSRFVSDSPLLKKTNSIVLNDKNGNIIRTQLLSGTRAHLTVNEV